MDKKDIAKEEIARKKHLFWDDVQYKITDWRLNETTREEEEYHYGRIACLFIVILCGIVSLFGSIKTVGAGEVGIITRFGEVNRVAESGLSFKIPLIEKMIKMPIRIQKQEVQTDAATKDLQEVNGAIAVNYSLTNDTALKVYKELGKDYTETIIAPILHESFKQGISKYNAEQLMANRTEVKEDIQVMLAYRLLEYGITVVDVNLTDLNFSAQFNAAIEQKVVMQQEAERAKQELEKVKIEAEAKIEAARAEAEAQRLQQETLSDAVIRKMWVEKWNGELPEVVSDSSIVYGLGQ